MNIGVKTYKQIAAENGTDWRTQIDDMAEVLEYAAEKGIDRNVRSLPVPSTARMA